MIDNIQSSNVTENKNKSNQVLALPITKALVALLGILAIGMLFDGGGSFF